MVLIEIEKRIFSFTFIIVMLLCVYYTFPKSISTDTSRDETDKAAASSPKEATHPRWQIAIELLDACIACLLLIFFALYLMYRKSMLGILLIGLGTPIYLCNILRALFSIRTVHDIIKSNGQGKMSLQELLAIEIIAGLIWFLGLYDCFNVVVDHVTNIQNEILSDFLLALSYTFVQFLYIFFTCSLFSPILSTLGGLALRITTHLPQLDAPIEKAHALAERTNNDLLQSLITVSWINSLKKPGRRFRWIGYTLMPILFFLDILKTAYRFVKSILFDTIACLLLILHVICKIINRFVKWCVELSGRMVAVISFRVALILSLALTVAINRYQPLLKQYSAGTPVLEFIASAIIIPAIFSWIHSLSSTK